MSKPRKASKAELDQRYLTFLSREYRCLAHEIGNINADGGVFEMEDICVNRLHEPDGRGGLLTKASTRARLVLAAAGVSLDHDPGHCYFGDKAPAKARKGAAA